MSWRVGRPGLRLLCSRFHTIAFFSFKYVRAGEELCWDYGYEIDSVPGKKIICNCGASNCKGRLL